MSARPSLREAVLAAIPDSWLDDLLTGPQAVVKIPAGCPEIQALLQGLKRRVEDIFERYAGEAMTLERAQEIVHKLERSGDYTYLEPTRPEVELDGVFNLEDLEALAVVIRHNQQGRIVWTG